MIEDVSRRLRRGQDFIAAPRAHPVEQEACLELPLGFDADVEPPSSVAVVLHAFHVHLLPELRAYLDRIPFPADLFISTDDAEKQASVGDCFSDWPSGSVTAEIVPNRGRDVAAKLVGFAAVHDSHEYVLHVHTKQSPHDQRLVGWRAYLLETLLGSPETVRGVFAAFAEAPRLGMVAPQHIDELRPWIRWSQNHDLAATLAASMGFPLPPQAPLDFPSGSMFWARSAALRPLLDLRLSFDDFPEELGQTDGTLAHAIERLYYLACEQAGFDWLKVTARDGLHDAGDVRSVSSREELLRFLVRTPIRLSQRRDEWRGVDGPPPDHTPPPKTRRILHVLWRRILGDEITVAPGPRVAIALRGSAVTDDLFRDAEAALRRLPPGVTGQVLAVGTASPNEALRLGFATGADLVLLLDRAGQMHPGSADAMLRMAEVRAGRVLLEGLCIPEAAPKSIDPGSFAVLWAGGPLLGVTRDVFERTGGFDARLEGTAAEQDLSRRAASSGRAALCCPRAIFHPLDVIGRS